MCLFLGGSWLVPLGRRGAQCVCAGMNAVSYHLHHLHMYSKSIKAYMCYINRGIQLVVQAYTDLISCIRLCSLYEQNIGPASVCLSEVCLKQRANARRICCQLALQSQNTNLQIVPGILCTCRY